MTTKYIGYSEAAEMLGIRVATLYSLVHERRIPHRRLGKRLVRFSIEDLEGWFNEHRVEVQSADRIVRAPGKRGGR